MENYKFFKIGLALAGVNFSKATENAKYLKVSRVRLIYGVLLLILYNVMWFARHYSVFNEDDNDEQSLVRWLYKLDTIIWAATVSIFLINNILQYKQYVELVNKMNNFNETVSVSVNKIKANRKFFYTIRALVIFSIAYVILLLILSVVGTQDTLLMKSHNPVISVIYSVLSSGILIYNHGFELFLIYMISLKLECLILLSKNKTKATSLNEILNAYDEIWEVMRLMQKMFETTKLSVVFCIFSLTALYLFYTYICIKKIIISGNCNDDCVSFLLTVLLWKVIYVPFGLICYFYGIVYEKVSSFFGNHTIY